MDARRSMLVGLAAGVCIFVGAAGAAGPATPVRATLRATSQPRADGVLVATLGGGRVLRWRLTFNGLSGPASAAHLHLGMAGRNGPVALKLCAPCTSGAWGKARLTPPAAAAVRGRVAYVDVHTADGSIRGQVASGIVPTLQLTGIADGATLRLPAAVHYVVTGFDGGIAASMAPGTPIELRPGSGPGVVYLPDDKQLTGRRDLTFALARADGTQLANREARVTVYRVLLVGRR